MDINTPNNQEGSALIVSLFILLVMTFLGVQGMQSSTLEERMSGNFRDRALAFEAAEAALRSGESTLNLQTSPPVIGSSGVKVVAFGSVDLTDKSVWTANAADATTGMSGLNAAPQYIIEERGEIKDAGRSAELGAITKAAFSGKVYSYRITSRAVGSTPNAVVLLQSNYEKVY